MLARSKKLISTLLIVMFMLNAMITTAVSETPDEIESTSLSNDAYQTALAQSILSPIEYGRTIIWNYLDNVMGFNQAAISGIISNMVSESELRTDALGDAGTSYGLCQWHNGRCVKLQEFAEEYGTELNDIDMQLAYFKDEMETQYPVLLEQLHAVENTEDGAYEAAYLMCIKYERPLEMEYSAVQRGYNARNEFSRVERDCTEIIGFLKSMYMVSMAMNIPIPFDAAWVNEYDWSPAGPMESIVMSVQENVTIIEQAPSMKDPLLNEKDKDPANATETDPSAEQAEHPEQTEMPSISPGGSEQEGINPEDTDVAQEIDENQKEQDLNTEPIAEYTETTGSDPERSEEPENVQDGTELEQDDENKTDETTADQDKDLTDPEKDPENGDAEDGQETDPSKPAEGQEQDPECEPSEPEDQEYFTVCFVYPDGGTIVSVNVPKGECPQEPSVGDYHGYPFIGWNRAIEAVYCDQMITAVFDVPEIPEIPVETESSDSSEETETNANDVFLVRFLYPDDTLISEQMVKRGEFPLGPDAGDISLYYGLEFEGWDHEVGEVFCDQTYVAKFCEPVLTNAEEGILIKEDNVVTPSPDLDDLPEVEDWVDPENPEKQEIPEGTDPVEPSDETTEEQPDQEGKEIPKEDGSSEENVEKELQPDENADDTESTAPSDESVSDGPDSEIVEPDAENVTSGQEPVEKQEETQEEAEQKPDENAAVEPEAEPSAPATEQVSQETIDTPEPEQPAEVNEAPADPPAENKAEQ